MKYDCGCLQQAVWGIRAITKSLVGMKVFNEKNNHNNYIRIPLVIFFCQWQENVLNDLFVESKTFSYNRKSLLIKTQTYQNIYYWKISGR